MVAFLVGVFLGPAAFLGAGFLSTAVQQIICVQRCLQQFKQFVACSSHGTKCCATHSSTEEVSLLLAMAVGAFVGPADLT